MMSWQSKAIENSVDFSIIELIVGGAKQNIVFGGIIGENYDSSVLNNHVGSGTIMKSNNQISSSYIYQAGIVGSYQNFTYLGNAFSGSIISEGTNIYTKRIYSGNNEDLINNIVNPTAVFKLNGSDLIFF